MKIQQLATVLPLPSVSTVVVDDEMNSYLFTQRQEKHYYMPGHYCLPGGMIEYGETIQQAAMREVREEIGEGNYSYVGQITTVSAVDEARGHWICVFNLAIRHDKTLPINPEPTKQKGFVWRPLRWEMPTPHLFGCPAALHGARLIIQRIKNIGN